MQPQRRARIAGKIALRLNDWTRALGKIGGLEHGPGRAKRAPEDRLSSWAMTEGVGASYESGRALEVKPSMVYDCGMADPTKRPLSEWVADLEISEAQVAAGDTVSIESVLAELDESIKRLEEKRRHPPSGREAVARR